MKLSYVVRAYPVQSLPEVFDIQPPLPFILLAQDLKKGNKGRREKRKPWIYIAYFFQKEEVSAFSNDCLKRRITNMKRSRKGL